MNIQLVAAVDRQGALGKNGTMAWYIPQELRHFKVLTMGGVLIMGRVTFESIGRPLPGRVSIVVSSKPAPETHPDTYWVSSIDAALSMAHQEFPERQVWVGGGAKVYAQMLDKASTIHLSSVPLSIEGADAYFPALDPLQWTCVETNDIVDGAQNKLLFTYRRYARAKVDSEKSGDA